VTNYFEITGDWNLQEWKMTDHQKTGVEFAGLENDGQSRRGEICRTEKWRTKNDGVEQEQTYAFLLAAYLRAKSRCQCRRSHCFPIPSNNTRITLNAYVCSPRLSTVVRTTHCSSCVLWATPLALTPSRYSPANTPKVPTTTTTTSSWHRLLPARRPQRRCQERQLLKTHHYGVVKYVCWHRSKALPWCPVWLKLKL